MAHTLSPQRVSTLPTVLIIDDNQDDLKHWSQALKTSSSKYSVLEATSVESGLKLCREDSVDCVLLDLDMPESGFHALLELIPDRTRPDIAIIIFTRLHHPTLFNIAKDNGAQTCLLKQRTSTQELDTAIHQAIAAVKSKQENVGGS